jgi:hypothetical protein
LRLRVATHLKKDFALPGVLYHPYFEPRLSWLRSSLLVYDNVWSIVPPEARYVPSDPIKRHLERLPDTFAPLAPDPLDIVSEYFVLRVLGRAFSAIKAQPKAAIRQKQRLRFGKASRYDEMGVLEISGVTKLHDAKIAKAVYDMLKEHRLIYGNAGDGFHYVNKQAAALIVSFLAQRMSTRLPIRTITDVDSSFYLSAACNVIEAGDPVDSRGVLASAILKFHIPEEIGEISIDKFIELRKRYEGLREAFPLYLRDLGELSQIDDIRSISDLKARIESLVKLINRDLTKIKRSRIGESIRKWLPVGIGSAVTLGAAFLPDTPSLKYVTGTATVAVQILAEALHDSPIPGRLQGAQSLLLKAHEEILDARAMAQSLDMRTILV